MKSRSLLFSSLAAVVLGAGACNAIFGIQSGSPMGNTGGGNTGGNGSSSTTASSSSGAGAGAPCTSKNTATCDGAVLHVCDATGHTAPAVTCPVVAACDAAARTCIDPATFGRLTVGSARACAIEDDRTVRCWGDNGGALIFTDQHAMLPTAQAVPGVSGARQISAGGYQVCALQDDGTLTCWGGNDSGELGTPAGGGKPPQPVPGVAHAVEVGAAFRCTCARIADGTVRCWGQSDTGCLGTGSPMPPVLSPPVQVPGVTGAVQLRAGAYETPSCARLSSGRVVCWNPSITPSEIPGVTDAIDVAVGFGIVFIRTPTGLFTSAPTPDKMAWLPAASYSVLGTITAMGAGFSFCGLLGDGTVTCAGVDGKPQAPPPALVPNLPPGKVAEIAVGFGNSYDTPLQCLRLAGQPLSSRVYCWGDDAYGALGTGAPEDLRTPKDVPGIVGATSLTTASQSTAVVLADGSVSFWGYCPSLGGLQKPSPATAAFLGTDNVAVTIGNVDAHAYAIKKAAPTLLVDGMAPQVNKRLLSGAFTSFTDAHDLYHWDVGLSGGQVVVYASTADANTDGVFGDGSTSATVGEIKAVPGLANVHALAAYSDDYGVDPAHVCVITGVPPGPVSCWGGNGSGEVGSGVPGNNVTVNTPTPVAIPGNELIVSIAAGRNFTCAVSATGKVSCWGGNDRGQLGVSGPGFSAVPVAVTGITSALGVTATDAHACAWLADKTAVCWGANDSGQLGNGTFDDASQPVVVTGLQNVVQVSAGSDHTCARRTNGSIACWGSSYYGQSGTGVVGVFPSPLAVQGL